MKKYVPMIAFAALLGAPALVLAQDAPPAATPATPPAATAAAPSDLRKVKKDDQVVAPWNLKVEDIEDMEVYDAKGVELGEIEAVLEDSTGQVKAVVVEFGGFFGFGQKEVIVGLDQLQAAEKRFTTALTKEELEKLPAWKG